MRGIATLIMLALIGLPGTVAADRAADADGTPLPIVRDREGNVLSGREARPKTKKEPAAGEAEAAEAAPAIIPLEAVKEMREALKPLHVRLNTRGMRTTEAAYAEELRLWAVRQDNRLQEHKKVLKAHDKLKQYRDGAAAKGNSTSRIDPRLKGMEERLVKSSGEIRLAYDELTILIESYQGRLKFMSGLMKTQEETARTIIENAPI